MHHRRSLDIWDWISIVLVSCILTPVSGVILMIYLIWRKEDVYHY